jgi:hypothetical protein
MKINSRHSTYRREIHPPGWKAADKVFATLVGIQTLLQKFMQSGWVAIKQ